MWEQRCEPFITRLPEWVSSFEIKINIVSTHKKGDQVAFFLSLIIALPSLIVSLGRQSRVSTID